MSGDASPRILMVRPSALGDVARTTPALVSLRRRWPEARIDWLVAAPYADAVRHHPMLDRVVPFRRDRLSGFAWTLSGTREGVGLYRTLREARYDVVYDLQGLARSGLFAWLTRAPKRVGFANAREGGWLGYTHRHRIDAKLHAVDRMLALLEADGVTAVRDLRLHVSDADVAWAAEQLPGAYACVAPTAAWLCKCWPLDHYTQIARGLLDRLPRVVVLAAPSERGYVQPMIDALLRELPPNDVHRVVCPRTTVGQMMAVLARAAVLVCNDSAALHLAVGLERPVVSIFGPTDPALVGPYPCTPDDPRVVVPPGGTPRGSYRDHDDQTLISTVPVEEVWQRVEATLA
jgi:heptosyltransferase-1